MFAAMPTALRDVAQGRCGAASLAVFAFDSVNTRVKTSGEAENRGEWAVEPDLTFFLFAVPAVLFAGVSKGGFGSGASFAATPLLALILTPGQAVGLMLPLLIVMDIAALRAFWGKWDRQASRALIIGSVPGIALGAAVYGIADPRVFKVLIGLVAIGFVIWQIGRRANLIRASGREMGMRGGMITGAVAGLTSFISHAGGPPAAVYLLTKPIDKTTYQATTVISFWVINLLKIVPYAMLGIFSRDTLVAGVYLAPVAVAGVLLGVVLHKQISERWFFLLTYAFLTVTGGKLIMDALS